MDSEAQNRVIGLPTSDDLSHLPVFPLIHTIRKDIEENIDTGLTWTQLTAPDVNFTTVRPLIYKYASLQNIAVVYACLVVRSYFLSLAEEDLAFSTIILTRANLAELLATKLLRHFTNSQLQLATVLTTPWNPLQGAPPAAVEQVKKDVGGESCDLDDPLSVLEVAISTESKHFLSSPLVQNIINDIWVGRIVFTSQSTHALVEDNYKLREVSIYNPRDGPFLDHYRLRVPKYRSILEFLNFALLLTLFVICLSNKDLSRMAVSELVFIIFAFGVILDEFAATQEHGWTIYIASVWNVFDMAFIAIFLSYFGLRLYGLTHHNEWYSDLAFDILSCGACLLFPRLVFFFISNNVIILALQAMISEFVFFMLIAAICFSGLLFTLHSLAGDKWPVKNIAWLMLQIWFGNTYLSFIQAETFHPVFGPILMVIFAALSNTLLITILISILSNTFARINEHASEEYLFQYAISTLERVKADAVLAYQPPFNLAAYVILTISGWFLSPRTLHTVHVFMVRVSSFPALIAIALYERYWAPGRGLFETGKEAASALFNSLPRRVKSVSLIDALVGSGSYDLLTAVLNVDLDGDEGQDVFGPTETGEASREELIKSSPRVHPSMIDEAEEEGDGGALPQQQSEGMQRGRYVSMPSMPPLALSSPTRRRHHRSLSRQSTTTGVRGIDTTLLTPHATPLARTYSVSHQLSAEDLAQVGRGRRVKGDEELELVKHLGERLELSGAGIREMSERMARMEEMLLVLTKSVRG